MRLSRPRNFPRGLNTRGSYRWTSTSTGELLLIQRRVTTEVYNNTMVKLTNIRDSYITEPERPLKKNNLIEKYVLASEWIEPEKPNKVLRFNFQRYKNTHPYQLAQIILDFLRSNGVPVLGQVDIEKMEKGRLFWDDFVDIGYRTFYYFRNEPRYNKNAYDKNYNICRLVCPICKELCGAVSDHIQLTEDILPRERQYHGCKHAHKWLDLKEGEEIFYRNGFMSANDLRSSIEIEIRTEKEKEELGRGITFEDI